MKPVLLINPNSSAQTTQAMLDIVRGHLADVQGWTNARAPSMITDPKALLAAGEQIAMADLPPARAIIVAAFGDPGAGGLADRLDVPVIGIGAAAARAAGQGRARFAVVTTTPRLAPAIDALMQAQGPGYQGCFLTDRAPEALMARMKDEANAFLERMMNLCDDAGDDADRVYQMNVQLFPLTDRRDDE